MSFSHVVLMGGTGVAINAISITQEHRDPFPAMLAGGLFITSLALIDEAYGPIASALAAVYLLAVLLFRGTRFFAWISALVGGRGAADGTPKN